MAALSFGVRIKHELASATAIIDQTKRGDRHEEVADRYRHRLRPDRRGSGRHRPDPARVPVDPHPADPGAGAVGQGQGPDGPEGGRRTPPGQGADQSRRAGPDDQDLQDAAAQAGGQGDGQAGRPAADAQEAQGA